MRYDRIYKAKFIERPNRVYCLCRIKREKGNGLCENTGRCAELLRPGADIYIQESDNLVQKDKVGLDCRKGSRMINMWTLRPGIRLKEWIEQGNLFGNVT